MKTNSNRRSGSLFRMLVVQYALFTLIVVVLFYGVMNLYLRAANGVTGPSIRSDPSRLAEKFAAGSYSSLSAEKLLGKGGYFEIVSADGRVVYTSRSVPAGDYGSGILTLIPALGGSTYCDVSEYGTGAERATSFTVTRFDEDYSISDSSLIVVGADGGVLYSSTPLPGGATRLSEAEQQLLAGKSGDYTVARLSFTGQDGTALTALLFSPPSSARQTRLLDLLDRAFGPVLIAGYVIVVLLFIWRLNRKVKKPLALLSDGMSRVADGSRGAQLSYRGPKEFEQMCASFNQMSGRLYQAEAERSRAEADKQKMLADISHDLKTPITVIQGYSKAICDGIIPKDQTDRYLATIYEKSTALTGLINTFYEYSKLSHPDFSPVLTRRDLCEYAREYLAGKYGEIELAGFSLEVEIPDEPLFCRLDEVQLKRVFENILTNALKHNPPGTRILFALSSPDARTARIEISDTGTGIPEALRATLFEPFVVGDDSRATRQGSGLGLAISRRVTEAHGGSIRLLAPGGGWATRFEILLPLAER